MESKFCYSGFGCLGLILIGAIIIGCGTKSAKEPIKEEWKICPSLDSIALLRREVPSWDDTGYYSEVLLGIGLPNGNYSVVKDDTVVVTGHIGDSVKSDLYAMLEEVTIDDMEKIYNVSNVEGVELELYFFCDNYQRKNMVKSFGQHGDNPTGIKELYSYLLRFTHGELQKKLGKKM